MNQTLSTPPSADIKHLNALVKSEMQQVDKLINNSLQTDIQLISDICTHIIQSGGKRLRPILAIIGARALGYQGSLHINIAAIIEFIHTATLLHDDVVDDSSLRRGQKTANAIWGNEASVLVGDFLYSRAFQMMTDLKDLHIMEILAQATNRIAEGEVLQLINYNNASTTEEQYLEVIRSKTAKLFEAAAQLSAILSKANPDIENAMARYGMHLGTAFQLIDDLLDYSASADVIGKNIGDDLAEGNPTLPLIHAMRNGNAEQKACISKAIENGERDNLAHIIKAIESTGAIAYTAQAAQDEADKAIAALEQIPASVHKDALISLAEFSVQRSY